VTIHDDTCFAALLNKLIEINNFLIETAAAVGLLYAPKKEYVFQLPDPTRPASASLASLRSDIDDVTKFVYDYFRCGGLPSVTPPQWTITPFALPVSTTHPSTTLPGAHSRSSSTTCSFRGAASRPQCSPT
jgi:hypothetical protein